MSFGARKRAVLVDGSWLVFRAFFAIPPNFTTKDGLHTNATYGFATMFKKLFDGKRPELGAVFFDSKEPTQREVQFPAYKAQRPSAPNELCEQFEWIDRVVLAHGFPIIRRPGFEADDLIATAARVLVEADYDVIIVAGDKDLAQLVSDSVRMHDTMKDVVYTPELVKKKWGVEPEQIADYLALVGDSADNIPGIAGVGAKTAAELFTRYKTLDEALADSESLKPKLRDALKNQAHELSEYRALTRVNSHLDTQHGIAIKTESLALSGESQENVRELYLRLQFHSLLADDTTTAELEELEVIAVSSLRAIAEKHPAATDIALQPVFALRAGAEETSLATASRHVIVVQAVVFSVEDAHYQISHEDLSHNKNEWFSFVRGKRLSMHDAKSLVLAWLNLGQFTVEELPSVFADCTLCDSMLLSFLIEPTKIIPHRLSQISKEYLQEGSVILDAPRTVLHAAHAAREIARLTPMLIERVEKIELWQHYLSLELPLLFVLAKMEHGGMAADKVALEALEVEFEAARAGVENKIFELAGRSFNLNSPKQLGAVLFDELQLPVVKKTKTGYSTDAEVLERLSAKHEIAAHIVRHRELSKLIQTYTRVLAAAVQADGRIHMSIQQTVGASGRLITAEPDLQRTPVRTPEGKRIREAFGTASGRSMLVVDWSQIELRVLAHLCGDPELMKAFEEGLDLHRQTASILFSRAQDQVSKPEREVAKTVNFATIYGQGASALGQILGIAKKDAEAYIRNYFAHYSEVARFLEHTIVDAKREGFVRTILGRRRYIPELASKSPMDEKAGERIACNTPIQGSAADLCKLAMVAIDKELARFGARARLVLQVHDELIFDVADDCVQEVREVVLKVMRAPMPNFRVPLEAEAGLGASWGLAKT